MSYGDGCIYEVKKPNGKSYNPKKWRVVKPYTVYASGPDGKTQPKHDKFQEIVNGTKADAKKKLAEFQEKAKRITSSDYVEGMTFADMIDVRMTARKNAGRVQERTLREDRMNLERFERHLKVKDLESITTRDVEIALNEIKEEYSLSGSTMNKLFITVKSVFQRAEDYEYILKNPCRVIETPKRDQPEQKALTVEEASVFLDEVNQAEDEEYRKLDEKEGRRKYREDHDYARDRTAIRGIHHLGNIIAARIGLFTGMRRGEVIGLCWKNVDLEEKVIHVVRSADEKGNIKSTKTSSGIRPISIDGDLVSHLEKWKQRQSEELAKLGIEADGDTPVCCTDTGSQQRCDKFTKWWGKWRADHGFPTLRFHDLRHTHATLLIAAGVDPKTVQTRLGHSSSSFTLDCYAHAVRERDHAAAQLFDGLLGGAKDTEPSPDRPDDTVIQLLPKPNRISPTFPRPAETTPKEKQVG